MSLNEKTFNEMRIEFRHIEKHNQPHYIMLNDITSMNINHNWEQGVFNIIWTINIKDQTTVITKTKEELSKLIETTTLNSLKDIKDKNDIQRIKLLIETEEKALPADENLNEIPESSIIDEKHIVQKIKKLANTNKKTELEKLKGLVITAENNEFFENKLTAVDVKMVTTDNNVRVKILLYYLRYYIALSHSKEKLHKEYIRTLKNIRLPIAQQLVELDNFIKGLNNEGGDSLGSIISALFSDKLYTVGYLKNDISQRCDFLGNYAKEAKTHNIRDYDVVCYNLSREQNQIAILDINLELQKIDFKDVIFEQVNGNKYVYTLQSPNSNKVFKMMPPNDENGDYRLWVIFMGKILNMDIVLSEKFKKELGAEGNQQMSEVISKKVADYENRNSFSIFY
jgi:hypothetical protein